MSFLQMAGAAIDSTIDMAYRISKNLKPATGEITDSLVNTARDKVLAQGIAKASVGMTQEAEMFAEKVGLKDGMLKSHYSDFIKASSGVNPDNMEDTFKSMRDILNKSGVDSSKSDMFMKEFKDLSGAEFERASEISKRINNTNVADYYTKKGMFDNPDAKHSVLGIADYAASGTKAYFNPADKAVGKTRRRVAMGTYATGAIGGRYIRGGSITQDPYGERDIAGVPFI